MCIFVVVIWANLGWSSERTDILNVFISLSYCVRTSSVIVAVLTRSQINPGFKFSWQSWYILFFINLIQRTSTYNVCTIYRLQNDIVAIFLNEIKVTSNWDFPWLVKLHQPLVSCDLNTSQCCPMLKFVVELIENFFRSIHRMCRWIKIIFGWEE